MSSVKAIRRMGGVGGLLGLLLAPSVLAQDAPPTMSFPSSASAITVDVVVLDKDGRPVRGLGKDDFAVSEDGKPQPIVGFEARDLTEARLEEAVSAGPVATNVGAASRPGRALAFVLDDLGLDPVRSGRDVTKAIARWLQEKADPRDEVTIATTSGDVWWTDVVARGKADLLAVLEGVRGKKSPHEVREYLSDWEASEIAAGRGVGGMESHTGAAGSSRGEDDRAPMTAGPPSSSGASGQQPEMGGVLGRVVTRWSKPGGACQGMGSQMCLMLVRTRSQEVHDRTLRRRRALVALVDRLSQALVARHGRKSIVLFSEGFIEIPRAAADESALDAARRANVAVYFVDARGLVALPFYNAENSIAPVQEDVGLMTHDLAFLSVAGGESLAEATGGRAFQSNDFTDSVARAADDSSAYYLLGYQPDAEPDGKWHDVKVAVNRPGTTVRARKGYFATQDPSPLGTQAGAASSQASSALVDPALLAGGERDAIPLRLVCSPVGAGPDGQRVLVGLDVGATSLQFDAGTALIDVTLLSVSRDKPILTPLRQRVTLSGGGEAAAHWWAYVKELVVPPGPAQIKALVRDAVTGRTGTVTQRLDTSISASSPRAFDHRSAAFLFEPTGMLRRAEIFVQVPVQGLGPAEGAAEPTRLALVARIDDASGRTVEQLAHEWSLGPEASSAAAPGQTLGFRAPVALVPGDYVLETAILHLGSGAASVDRQPIRVPASAGLALSSVVLLGGGAPMAGAGPSPVDPFRVGSVAFVPRLDERIPQGTAELPLFFRVYPAGDEPLTLSLEVQREGTRLVEQKPSLPAADEGGGLAWLGSLPLAALPAGRYAIVVHAQQGEAAADESLRFEVVARGVTSPPAAGPSVSPPPKPGKDDRRTELAQALGRAGQYVMEYARTFQNLVAEEVYEQQTQTSLSLERRRTRADIVFVGLEGAFPWGSFRDVFEVDGHEVRDRQSRLEALFQQQGPSALDQARAIRAESSRYNIGLARSVNEPMLPLIFLLPANQQRFRFRAHGHKKIADVEGLEVEFEEVARPTMIRDDHGENLPANGRVWIAPATGVVLKSSIVFDLRYQAGASRAGQMMPSNPKGWMEVEYRPEASLSIWVPARMTEGYPFTQASAHYSGYRRFSVDTMEAIRGPQ